MLKKSSKLIIIIAFTIFLTACWDYQDIDKRSITSGIGIDKVNDKIEFSAEIAQIVPTSKMNGEESNSPNAYTAVSYGNNFEEARLKLDTELPHPIFLGATKVAVFGENYAREGIRPYLNRIDKIYDYRKTILSVVSREPVSEIFSIKTDRDFSVSFLIENTINSLKDNGKTIYRSLGQILSDIAMGPVGDMIPYVGIENKNIKYLGLAVMKNAKLIGIINIEETGGPIYLLADKPQLIEEFKNPNNPKNTLAFRITVKNRNIDVDYENGKVIIGIDMKLKAELNYQYYIDPINDDLKKQLEKILSEIVKNKIKNIIIKSQEEYECDIFRMAKHFRAKYPELYKNLDWEKEYTRAELNVNIETFIHNLSLNDPNAKPIY